VAGMLRIKR